MEDPSVTKEDLIKGQIKEELEGPMTDNYPPAFILYCNEKFCRLARDYPHFLSYQVRKQQVGEIWFSMTQQERDKYEGRSTARHLAEIEELNEEARHMRPDATASRGRVVSKVPPSKDEIDRPVKDDNIKEAKYRNAEKNEKFIFKGEKKPTAAMLLKPLIIRALEWKKENKVKLTENIPDSELEEDEKEKGKQEEET